jgi:hypothetical protein
MPVPDEAEIAGGERFPAEKDQFHGKQVTAESLDH